MDAPHKATLTRGMRVAIGVVASVVVIGAIVAVTLLNTPSAPTAAPAQAAASASPAAGHVVPPTPGPLPEATPTTGSETLRTATAEPYRLPDVSAPPALVSAPLPKSAAKDGGLVTGFPKDVMGPAAGSSVVSSSIAAQGSAMQVSLVARTAKTPKDVRDHYEKLWGSLGLLPGRADDGTITYTGAHESVSLAFSSTGTGDRYTVFGVFRTE